MRLLRPFEYVDGTGRRWPVPPGVIVDGASIPKVFWSIIGGPFEGPYRASSVVHDYFCEIRTRKYADVHKTFYEGMLTSGVRRNLAWLMYKAVDRFGPRWDDPGVSPDCEIVADDYDFERCARNTPKPAAQVRSPTRGELERFAVELKSQVDPADYKKLKSAIEAVN